MFNRQCRLLCVFHAMVLIPLIGAGTALAQSASETEAAAPAARNWLVTCDNRADAERLACVAVQTLTQTETRQRIVTARIANGPDGRLYMVLSLPHGLDLPAGVSLSIDDGIELTTPIQTADANGAYSRIELTSEFLNTMKRGNEMVVKLSGSSGNAIELKMSLSGFSNAISLVAN